MKSTAGPVLKAASAPGGGQSQGRALIGCWPLWRPVWVCWVPPDQAGKELCSLGIPQHCHQFVAPCITDGKSTAGFINRIQSGGISSIIVHPEPGRDFVFSCSHWKRPSLTCRKRREPFLFVLGLSSWGYNWSLFCHSDHLSSFPPLRFLTGVITFLSTARRWKARWMLLWTSRTSTWVLPCRSRCGCHACPCRSTFLTLNSARSKAGESPLFPTKGGLESLLFLGDLWNECSQNAASSPGEQQYWNPHYCICICRCKKAFRSCGTFASVHVSVLGNKIQSGALGRSTGRAVVWRWQHRWRSGTVQLSGPSCEVAKGHQWSKTQKEGLCLRGHSLFKHSSVNLTAVLETIL